MTRTDSGKRLLPPLLCLFCLIAAGCGKEVDAFPEPGGAGESSAIIRNADRGGVVVAFANNPLRRGVPPPGVVAAVRRAIGRRPCSAAAFYWSEKLAAERLAREQLELRLRQGWPARLILVGHGLGATEASEVARDILAGMPEAEIALLLTVDAVKPGRMGQAAGMTGAVVNHLPGVNTTLGSYDAAPIPDGQRFRAHINYYQEKSQLYHGAPMPGAENHMIEDWTGLLNHGNADDFALPLLTADIRAALERGAQ